MNSNAYRAAPLLPATGTPIAFNSPVGLGRAKGWSDPCRINRLESGTLYFLGEPFDEETRIIVAIGFGRLRRGSKRGSRGAVGVAVLLRARPDLRSDLTDVLIGKFDGDLDALFGAAGDLADIPGPLPHGAPLEAGSST